MSSTINKVIAHMSIKQESIVAKLYKQPVTKAFLYSKNMNDKIIWRIELPLLIYLTLGFILATIIGTVSHESGHYLVAKFLGFNAEINYNSTWILNVDEGRIMSSDERFLITLGGPFQTMLTGTIGFILLFAFHKSFYKVNWLTFFQWVLILFTLFWLRQVANFIIWLGKYVFTGKLLVHGDEIKLSRHLQVPDWTIISVTAILGVVIFFIVLFKFIPKFQRFTFILSGLIGGILGYLFWFEWAGKIIMP